MRRARLRNCPPGFFLFNGSLHFRSEYGEDAYVGESGEYFWGGAKTRVERANLMVQPVPYKLLFGCVSGHRPDSLASGSTASTDQSNDLNPKEKDLKWKVD